MSYQGLKSRLKKLERSLQDEFQTVIFLEDGTELAMDIRNLFHLVVRWNTLPFIELSERRLTEDDFKWIDKLALATPNREVPAYALVIGAKKAAVELLENVKP